MQPPTVPSVRVSRSRCGANEISETEQQIVHSEHHLLVPAGKQTEPHREGSEVPG